MINLTKKEREILDLLQECKFIRLSGFFSEVVLNNLLEKGYISVKKFKGIKHYKLKCQNK